MKGVGKDELGLQGSRSSARAAVRGREGDKGVVVLMVKTGRIPLVPFVKRESYTHKLAKELLCKWQSENSQIAIEYNGHIYHTHYAYHFTVTEYPITDEFPQLLDEVYSCGTNIYKKNEDGGESIIPGLCTYRENGVECPCIECSFFDKFDLLAVADIVTGYKGLITNVFEIVHKNQLSEKKIQLYRKIARGYDLKVYVLEAQHILGQIEKPKLLHAKLVS